jgi:hypothetical protein
MNGARHPQLTNAKLIESCARKLIAIVGDGNLAGPDLALDLFTAFTPDEVDATVTMLEAITTVCVLKGLFDEHGT